MALFNVAFLHILFPIPLVQTDEEGNLFIQGGENPVIPVDQDRFPLSGDIARPSGCGNAGKSLLEKRLLDSIRRTQQRFW